MQTNIDLKNHKIINLDNPNDGDAVNIRTLDIVESKINEFSYFVNNHLYKNVFQEFYDLIETSKFNLIQGVIGVVINKINPNFILQTDRFITDYNPKYGLRLSTKTHLQTTNILNQDSNYTIFKSFLHDKTTTCEISFSNTLNIHIKFYLRFRITENKLIMDYQTGTYETQFTPDLISNYFYGYVMMAHKIYTKWVYVIIYLI